MSREELLKLLNLNKPAAGGAGDLADGCEVITGGPPAPAAPPSPTALKVDAWGLRRGREVLAGENHRLRQACLPGKTATGAATPAEVKAAEIVTADCFAAAFEPSPELSPRCEDAARGEFFKQLLDTPEYQELHQTTQLDAIASELAGTSFAEQVAVVCQRVRAARRRPGDGGAMRAVAKALGDASKDVGEYSDACNALGCGPGAGGNGQMDTKRAAAAFARVRNSAQLRRIAELAGRFRRVAAAKQRQKVTHALDEVAGVELGADLGRLLPSELVKLADEELELDALRRLRAADPAARAAGGRAGREGAGGRRRGREREHERRAGRRGQGAGPGRRLGRPAAAAVVLP
jgi:hypothetical protein